MATSSRQARVNELAKLRLQVLVVVKRVLLVNPNRKL
jgi:hypothetical protein